MNKTWIKVALVGVSGIVVVGGILAYCLIKAIKEKISEPVLADLQKEREYWTKYQGNAAKLSSIFYDNYLKINKQPEGLKTYNRMIKLTMAYYKKKDLIKYPFL